VNPQLIHQIASQRVSEIRQEAASCHLAAADREPRKTISERAGWALIDAGLKLTGPPSPRGHVRARPSNL
jgi:hypothetical protein